MTGVVCLMWSFDVWVLAVAACLLWLHDVEDFHRQNVAD
jgi:hypothetical protein